MLLPEQFWVLKLRTFAYTEPTYLYRLYDVYGITILWWIAKKYTIPILFRKLTHIHMCNQKWPRIALRAKACDARMGVYICICIHILCFIGRKKNPVFRDGLYAYDRSMFYSLSILQKLSTLWIIVSLVGRDLNYFTSVFQGGFWRLTCHGQNHRLTNLFIRFGNDGFLCYFLYKAMIIFLPQGTYTAHPQKCSHMCVLICVVRVKSSVFPCGVFIHISQDFSICRGPSCCKCCIGEVVLRI